MGKVLIGLSIAVLLGVLGFVFLGSQKPKTLLQAPVTPKVNPQTTDSPQGIAGEITTLQGRKLAISYFEFIQADFNSLLAQKQPFLLYFYANWCPICRAMEPELLEFMNQGKSGGIPVLRVNYNDSDTGADEKALAQKYTITYQHTFVAIDANGSEIDRRLGHLDESQLNQLFAKLASTATPK